jgi:hypothetical protein
VGLRWLTEYFESGKVLGLLVSVSWPLKAGAPTCLFDFIGVGFDELVCDSGIVFLCEIGVYCAVPPLCALKWNFTNFRLFHVSRRSHSFIRRPYDDWRERRGRTGENIIR